MAIGDCIQAQFIGINIYRAGHGFGDVVQDAAATAEQADRTPRCGGIRLKRQARGRAVGCGARVDAADRDVACRTETHIATLGLQRGAVSHGDCTGCGLQVDRHGGSAAGDVGVLQDGAARHHTGVAHGVKQRATQGDVAGSATGIEQDVVCSADVA